MFAQRQVVSALLAAASIGAACSCVAADDQKKSDEGGWSASVGAEHESGKYGRGQTTDIWTFPLDATYLTSDYLLDLSVPYVRIKAPAGGTAGRARHRADTPREIVTTQGVGDSTLSATRFLVDGGKSGLSWDIGGIVKFATGDVHKGLGTGANDYSLLTTLAERMDEFSLSGTLGRWWLGNAGVQNVNGVQENLKFLNPFYATLDASYKTGDTSRVGASVFGEQVAEKGGFPQREATLYASFDTSESTDLRIYVLKGFSKGSPDRGAGVTFTSWF
jgi:hypothetical protein